MPRVRAGELVDVAVAQVALLAALLRARFTPTGRLVAPSPCRAAGPERARDARPVDSSASEERGERPEAAARAARAVDRAARRGLFRPTCLVRSLALARLLERQGLTGVEIRIGVRRGVAGRPDASRAEAGGAEADGAEATDVRAHAWVELDGRVVGEDPRHVAAFTPVGSVTAASRR